MKKLLILVTILLAVPLYAGLEDYSFKPLREKIKTKEDFYRIFNKWLYADLDSTSRNIFFLELATVVPFDHPIKALVPITNELQYERYKNLLQMHIYRMLTQEYIDYGYMYMKEHIYFFNKEFKKEYMDGYEVAEFYFNNARKYWDKAIAEAQAADSIAFNKTALHYMEDEVYKIKTGELDYYKVVDNLMVRINRNREEIVRLWGTNDLTNKGME